MPKRKRSAAARLLEGSDLKPGSSAPSPKRRKVESTKPSSSKDLEGEIQRLKHQVERRDLEMRLLKEKAARELDAEKAAHRLSNEQNTRRLALAEEREKRRSEQAARQLAEAQAKLETERALRTAAEERYKTSVAESRVRDLTSRLATANQKSKAVSDRKLELRLKRFPWLRKPRWNALPDALLGHILTFLPDDDLFGLRVLGSVFYNAYFRQRIWVDESRNLTEGEEGVFNDHRAIRLARMGRVFPRVEFLIYDVRAPGNPATLPPLQDSDLSAISPRSFPALTFLSLHQESLKNASLRNLPGHPGLQFLSVDLVANGEDAGSDDLKHISSDRFPNLRRLQLGAHRLTELPEHPNLERILLPTMEPHREAWSLVTRERFPRLKIVEVWQNGLAPGVTVGDVEAWARSQQVRLRVLNPASTNSDDGED